MVDLTLIPFGFSPEKKEFLDVADVPRGRGCGCICPSCKTPLIARHGDIKEWHFAHATRNVYKKTESECNFSFFVSVRMMARQVVSQSLKFAMPEYRSYAEKRLPRSRNYIDVQFTIAEKQTIELADIELEKVVMNVPVDIFGYVKGSPLLLYLTHPGRRLPYELSTEGEHEYGVIEISLEDVAPRIIEARKAGQSYREVLLDFLVNDLNSKSWVSHPRFNACKKEAHQKLAILEAEFQNTSTRQRRSEFSVTGRAISTHPPKVTSRRRASFVCIMCNSQWKDWHPSSTTCPKCKTHLYSRVLEYLDNQ